MSRTAYKDSSPLSETESTGALQDRTHSCKDAPCQFSPSNLITNKEFYKKVTLLQAFLKLNHGSISWKPNKRNLVVLLYQRSLLINFAEEIASSIYHLGLIWKYHLDQSNLLLQEGFLNCWCYQEFCKQTFWLFLKPNNYQSRVMHVYLRQRLDLY